MTADDVESIFREFLKGQVASGRLLEISRNTDRSDVGNLMEKVSRLGDPSDFTKNDLDSKTVEGFFSFLDFVSFLLIEMGEEVREEMAEYGQLKGKFVPWVIRYVSDERFHNELRTKYKYQQT